MFRKAERTIHIIDLMRGSKRGQVSYEKQVEEQLDWSSFIVTIQSGAFAATVDRAGDPGDTKPVRTIIVLGRVCSKARDDS